MLARSISWRLGSFFLLYVCTLGGLPRTFAMQTPDDQYDVGPDPIAGSLLEQKQNGTSSTDKAKNEKDSILDLDIEQLGKTDVLVPAMQAEIETVSRTTTTLAKTPSAVYVVTNEMIRRCGARNIPEVLRTVPGVNVARINASAWAISIRGFNGRFSKNLLVQIDGIAIYSPTHSGVFWEREYVMLHDVERIEVIRGPGAAVWGINAVNGVINIITKSATDTHGPYADGGGGNEHRQFGDFRVGGRTGNNFNWRVYGFTSNDNRGYVPPPDIADDYLTVNQGGFRTDWMPNRHDTFTIQGDFYQGVDGQVGVATPPATSVAPMFCHTSRLLVRWTRKIDENTDWEFQTYYYNPFALDGNKNQVSAFDMDFQYHVSRGQHDIVCGCEYRNYDERWVGFIGQPFEITATDNEQIPSYFIQDTIELSKDRFYLTLGSKFDHNSTTFFEYQPTIRATWTPNERTSVWGAISRAVRTPGLVDRVFVTPNSETVLAYELGIRQAPNDRFFWELATFYNRYRNLLATNSFLIYDNAGEAESYGFELNGNYKVNDRWRFTGWYAFLATDSRYLPGYSPLIQTTLSPRNEFYLQSSWDLGRNVSLEVMFRYVDNIYSTTTIIPNYFAGDVRLAWRPKKNLEFSVVGQNLLAGRHFEFPADVGTNPTQVSPWVYGMVSWGY